MACQSVRKRGFQEFEAVCSLRTFVTVDVKSICISIMEEETINYQLL